jgi:hypothetical protein
MTRFLLVTAIKAERPDLQVMINMASVQLIRGRVESDREGVGAWICWNTLDEPLPVRESFQVLCDSFDRII